MRRRLVILTEIISPYRIPLFNELSARPEIDLKVIFLAETDPGLRQWDVHKDGIRFSYEVLPSWRWRFGTNALLVNRGVSRSLQAAQPDSILCGGYNYLASWQALLWARSHKVPFLLWSESNLQDMRQGHAVVEFLKEEYLQRCAAFVVPGISARKYLEGKKVAPGRIFQAPNAVDNEFFAAAAAIAREKSTEVRHRLNLPRRYFLFTGRLVPEKGVFDLLAAYAKLDAPLREQIGLVFVGDGTSRSVLEKAGSKICPGTIRFAGFVQQTGLAAYYGLAEVLILPTHTDTWGLVVNEAMASGLPIILSRAAGCATDLLAENLNGRKNGNGFLISPKDTDALASAMTSVAQDPEICKILGANSLERIARYSPAEWAKGIVKALENARGAGD